MKNVFLYKNIKQSKINKYTLTVIIIRFSQVFNLRKI